MKWVKKDDSKTIKEVVMRNITVPELEFEIDENRVYRIDRLDEVVSKIKECIDNNENIRIVGDYDADGVTSTSILYMALISLGAKVSYRLPKRISEGYGLSEKIVDEIDNGLVITVDNGIAAIDAIKKAKEKGLYVIVIDHHLRNDKNELPDADIIIDPNAIENSADFNGYCGAGLAYRVAEKLLEDNQKLLDKLLCFAAIGTIADVMELVSENRRIVKNGLKNMESFGKRTTGLASLLSICEISRHVSASDIGFRIGPMLNAPGRLYDDGARKSVEVLTYNSKYDESKGKELFDINAERKEIVAKSVERTKNVIIQNCLFGDEPMIVYVPQVPEGIVGILAGRIAEDLNTPTIIFTDTEDPNILKGSGRTARSVHLKNLLDSCSEHIYKYGGHAEAAGISIERSKLDEFICAMQEHIEFTEEAKDDDVVYYDLEIDAKDIKPTMLELDKFAPFGNGNPDIVFKINNYRLSPRYSSYYKLMGADDSTIKLFGVGSSALWFNESQKYLNMKEPKQLTLIGKLSRNYFKDTVDYQVEIIDAKDDSVKVEKSALGKRLEEMAKKRRLKEGEPA
mgnify:CR=1 FL=1